ncbi:hypothetical protein NL676_008248 [Syzygium grande]|nr:hypothetical protein NL676_008248 [Syzygium grande]
MRLEPVTVVLLTVELDGDRRRACGKGWPKRIFSSLEDWASEKPRLETFGIGGNNSLGTRRELFARTVTLGSELQRGLSNRGKSRRRQPRCMWPSNVKWAVRGHQMLSGHSSGNFFTDCRRLT